MKNVLKGMLVLCFIAAAAITASADVQCWKNKSSIPADGISSLNVYAYVTEFVQDDSTGTYIPVITLVTFSIYSGDGNLIGDNPVLTDSNGMASITYVSSTNPGEIVVEAATGNYGSDTTSFQLTALPQPPSVTALADPINTKKRSPVNFTADAVDPDGYIVSFLWDFGDGKYSVDPAPAHSYNRAGDYTATVVVTDNDGLEASDSIIIHVTNSDDGGGGGKGKPKK